MNSKQLMSSILQQAMQGQLVPQLDSEPEVAQFGPAPAPDAVPFEIPPKWKWVQIGALLPFGGSNQVKPESIPANSWLLGLEEIESDGDLIKKIRSWDRVGSNKNAFKAGDVLYSKMRPYLNKVIIADEPGFCSTELLVLDVNQAKAPLFAGYLLYFLRAPYFVSYATVNSHGQKPRLDLKRGKQAWMPLPPLEEQRRIVARIEEIRPLVESIGEAQEQLAQLEADFPRKLKASLLQQAIAGQLVPQLDSEPEVAQVGPAPAPDAVPFEIPPKWKWVQLEQVFSMAAGKNIKANLIKECGKYPCYGGNGLRGYTDCCNVSGTYNLIGRQGALCGNVHLVSGEFYATEHAIVARHDPARVDPQCAFFFLTALNLNQYATATAQPGLAVSKIAKTFYPLPPLEEQRRIVAKLDELLPEVDKLGSLLKTA